MSLIRLLACVLLAAALAGCNTTKKDEPSAKSAYVPVAAKPIPRPARAEDPVPMEPAAWLHPNRPTVGALAGRTLTVSSIAEIKLQPKEVILTFDDGPAPGKTERILDTLDQHGVKATFLMVGEMAMNHPRLARKVVERGHSVGSHTWRHANLQGLGFDRAMNEILRGESVVKASSGAETGFFRFPYLADTAGLRAALARRGTVVLDVAVDSKDYFHTTPPQIIDHTMAALRRKGGGIILMHDLHARTAAMLPGLLAQLKSEGYKVVSLRYKRTRMQMIASAQ